MAISDSARRLEEALEILRRLGKAKGTMSDADISFRDSITKTVLLFHRPPTLRQLFWLRDMLERYEQ